MKPFYQMLLVEQTIWIPIALCFLRFANIKTKYLPLCFYLITRAILEVTGNLVVIFVKPRPVFGNIPFYNLMFISEALLVTWQLYNLGALKNKKLYHLLQITWLVTWATDAFFTGFLTKFNYAFQALYSFVLLFVIVSFFGKLATSQKQNLYRNADFCISIGFALWFIYSIFYVFSKSLVVQDKQLLDLSDEIITFLEFAEAILYLIIAWAIYCIPPKRSLYPK